MGIEIEDWRTNRRKITLRIRLCWHFEETSKFDGNIYNGLVFKIYLYGQDRKKPVPLADYRWRVAPKRQNINIVPADKEIADYTSDKATSPNILEENIIDLLQKDKKLAAINIVRKTYGYSHTEAKDFVESLIK